MRISGSRVDMEDWTEQHQVSAAREGWCIVEVGLKDTPSYLVVRNVEDSDDSAALIGKGASVLSSDEEAVESFRQSWVSGRDHAILAYNLLKFGSPSEFYFWRMASWDREEMA